MQVGPPCSSRSQNAKATDHLFVAAVGARACSLGVEAVPFRAIAGFTFSQLVYLLVVYGSMLICAVLSACRLLEQGHAPWVEIVSFRAVAGFTIFQLVYLLVVYGITWIPVAGFLFPLPIIALIPARALILPKVARPAHQSSQTPVLRLPAVVALAGLYCPCAYMHVVAAPGNCAGRKILRIS